MLARTRSRHSASPARRNHALPLHLTVHRGAEQIDGSCIEFETADGARLILDADILLIERDGVRVLYTGDFRTATAIPPP
jgi:hypothetical protein